jgi:GH35 family endo-1,4-beta-xylanase
MFRKAHKLDPSAVLFVNDYNVEDKCDSKSTPVGGIGVHLQLP